MRILCFQYMGNYKAGSWWFRIFGYGILLKAPRCKALFSERNGYEKFRYFSNGWRYRYLKPIPSIDS